jgi:hypothetical protein
LQLILNRSQQRCLPVINDSFIGFHLNDWHHALGQTDTFTGEINNLVSYGFKMKLDCLLIFLKHHRCGIFVNQNQSRH